MSRTKKPFTEEQIQELRKNPYVFSVTRTRLTLTKEFKEIFLIEYNAGEIPRNILINHGFDVSILGDKRVWSISCHIREEYKKYGNFHEGYAPRNQTSSEASEKDELKQLRHEVEYLKQEMEFLKKISSIRSTRK